MSLETFVLILAVVFMVTWMFIAILIGVVVYRFSKMAQQYAQDLQDNLSNAKGFLRKVGTPLIASSPVLLPVIGLLWRILRKRRLF